MNDLKRNKLTQLFKSEVSALSKEIDPNSSQDWYSLTIGWAIAKGLSPDDSHDFANHIRYHTSLG